MRCFIRRHTNTPGYVQICSMSLYIAFLLLEGRNVLSTRSSGKREHFPPAIHTLHAFSPISVVNVIDTTFYFTPPKSLLEKETETKQREDTHKYS